MLIIIVNNCPDSDLPYKALAWINQLLTYYQTVWITNLNALPSEHSKLDLPKCSYVLKDFSVKFKRFNFLFYESFSFQMGQPMRTTDGLKYRGRKKDEMKDWEKEKMTWNTEKESYTSKRQTEKIKFSSHIGWKVSLNIFVIKFGFLLSNQTKIWKIIT